MAYRKYNTYYKKKYGYRKKKNFSKFNLYRNRSSKSQAYQIYNLNKKINMIEKKTKPDISENQDMIIDVTGNVASGYARKISVYNYKTFFEGMMTDNLTRIQNLTLYGNISTSDFTGQDGTNYTSYLRLMVVQTKTRAQEPPSELLECPSDLRFVTSPLKKGFSQTVKLLYDKFYVITQDKNSRNMKIVLKNVDNVRRTLVDNTDPNNPVYEYDGIIYVYAYFGASNSTAYNFKLGGKLMYVEDN